VERHNFARVEKDSPLADAGNYFMSGDEPPRFGLKVSCAFAAVMPRTGAPRFFVLESGLALGAGALGLVVSRSTGQFDVTYGSVRTEVPGDREIIYGANGG
jgi:hypothetical protein